MRPSSFSILVLFLLAALIPACAEDHGREDDGGVLGPADSGRPADAGRPDGGARCAVDSDCDDGLYCTGHEICSPTNTRADAFGCVPGNDPCVDGLICTIEPVPACDEGARSCNAATFDHTECPPGAYCLPFVGCSIVDPCPADGSACPDDDDPCRVPTCDTAMEPPLCIPMNAPDDTPCGDPATGTMGICRRGECCTDCA
jgi:hypothetical protein